MYISTESVVLNELSTLELCDKTTGISCQISLGLVMKRIKQCPIRSRNCPVGQLAEKSTSPSQKYHLSFLIIVKQGHSSSRTSSLKLKSSFPDCWSSRTIGLQGQFRALPIHELNICYMSHRCFKIKSCPAFMIPDK